MPPPITWLKASNDNIFISEFVIDCLVYDAYEPYCRAEIDRNSWELSNIIQFLNSEAMSDWFCKSHERDSEPSYLDHPGFLSFFEREEIECLDLQEYKTIDGECRSVVRIPTVNEIQGKTLPLFKRHGLRGIPSYDSRHKFDCCGCTAFAPYWLLPDEGGRLMHFDISCRAISNYPSNYSGIRPIIKLKPDTIFVQIGKSYALKKGVFCTEFDIAQLLGTT